MKYRYPCAPPCQGGWNKSGPFNRHIQTCEHWQVHEESKRKRRVEVEAAQPLKKRRKLLLKKVLYLGHFTQRAHLSYSQAKNRQDTTLASTDANLTFGNTDVDAHMPGAFLEESSSNLQITDAGNAPVVPVEPATQSRQPRRAPVRFQDVLPEPPAPVTTLRSRLPAVYLMVTNPLKTAINSFGLFREYLFHPSYDPDALVNPGDLSNLATHTLPPPPPPPPSEPTGANRQPPWPFANMTVWRLMRWLNTGSKSKSEEEADRLVETVFNAPDLHADDLRNFSARRENGRLDAADKTNLLEDGFQVTSITIDVPTGKPGDPSAPRTYSVPGLRYRKLLNVIKAAFQEPLSRQFHLTPFSLKHQSPVTNKEQRVYGELYNSDEFIKEHNRVQNCSPPPPDDPTCALEKVIAALMFWSDATHLANFGTAKLWPIYLFFGNLSKYIRSRPSSGACNHLAYIPSVCVLYSQKVFLLTRSTAPRLI